MLSERIVVEIPPQPGIGRVVEVDDALVAFHASARDGCGEKGDGTGLEVAATEGQPTARSTDTAV
jgi:hypothetical protein